MPAVQCTRMIACTFAHTPTQAWTELDFFSILCSRTTLTDMSTDTSRHVEMDTNTKI